VLVPPFDSLPQRNSVTHQPDSTIQVVAALDIIDAIAVANIETGLAAVPPDRVLDEPGKGLRELEVLQPKHLPVQNSHDRAKHQFVLLAARTKAASSALKRAVSSQKGA
jgi:hypothetical protein